MKHKQWILFSGFLWLCIGVWLLLKGIFLISEGALGSHQMTSFSFRYFTNVEQGAVFLIALGLLVGFIKGRFVLSKTVKRVCLRIAALSLPIRLQDVYSPYYFLLIAFMMLFGIVLRWIPISLDLKGAIDVAIGSALIHGALLYVRAARARF